MPRAEWEGTNRFERIQAVQDETAGIGDEPEKKQFNQSILTPFAITFS